MESLLLAADKSIEADVWGEPIFLAYLQTNECHDSTPDPRKHLYKKRAKSYRTWGDKIFKVLADGVEREVPKPEDCRKFITDSHERTGHFGTLHLLPLKYWWKGRKNDVAAVLQICDMCDRLNQALMHNILFYILYLWKECFIDGVLTCVEPLM
jgi:hypothetical protein